MLYRIAALLCLVISLNQLTAQSAARYSIVIDEIFPDPSPVIGLPNSEFIELKNVSSVPFNLRNWKLSDGSSTATININFILQPDGFVIICPNSAVTSFTPFGNTIGVSNFPSLNNDADVITLYSPEGITIHAVSYSAEWYQNAVKSDGGWTLEMIDTKNPCAGINNWKASVNNTGGTPGRKNSIDGDNKDDLPPALSRTYTADSITIIAVFDEPLDSNHASNISDYTIDNGNHPVIASPSPPLFTEVILKFSVGFRPRTIYQLIVKNVTDCSGNSIGILNKVKAGVPLQADSFDIVINELLFNPKAGGYDYIELYNRSDKIIDLKKLYVANRNVTGTLVNIRQVAIVPYLFFPGEYIVLTENSKWLRENYPVKDYSRIIEMSALPSLPDDNGIIVLTNLQGNVVEELHYDEKWHFALIDNNNGVALERINYDQPTNEKSNWTSAASTAGYGTPASQNSQFRADLQAQGLITILSPVFSPDNDGIDDFANIKYQMTEPGYVANITVFDINGRPIRYLAKNATLGLNGYFRWDGLDDKLNKLSTGIYIILAEIFNLHGKTKKFKNVITLAKKF